MHLLLLHGALGSKAQLENLQNALSRRIEQQETLRSVRSINFSGHGGEGPADTRFDMPTFVNDVLRYLDAQQIDTVDIFGYSMGGYVALYLAKMHPSRVGKIYTLGTKFDWTPESAEKESRMLNPDKLLEKVPHFAQALEQRHQPLDWREVLTKTAEMMRGLGNGAALTHKDLETIQHHVQIGIGGEDNMVTLAESQAAAEALPKGHLRVYPTFKHPIEQINVDELADSIMAQSL